MTDQAKKEPEAPATPPAEPKTEPAAKGVSIDDVNGVVAEAVTQLKAELEGQITEAIDKVAEQLQAALKSELEQVAELVRGKGVDELADGITEAVKHELHHLHGLIDNVINTIDKSIGQRVNRNVAPRPADHPLPSEIDAPPPVQGEGAETAASVG